VGGYSVWSALPPLPPKAAAQPDAKPIILVVAQMDAMDMFHDAAQVMTAVMCMCTCMIMALQVCMAEDGRSACFPYIMARGGGGTVDTFTAERYSPHLVRKLPPNFHQ